MCAVFCLSIILQVAYCQVLVKEVVYAWLDSHVTLECRANTNEEIKQITWEMQTDGTRMTFLTYRNDTGAIFPTLYGKRVRFKGDGSKDGSIQIVNVSLADEGIFKCVFTTFPSGTIEGRTQLQVMVLPTVMQELTPDVRTPCSNMVAECTVFSAKPVAEIQWITHGINYTSKEEEPVIHPNGTTSRRSQLYMKSTLGLYGREVICLVYQPKIPHEYQENITVNNTLVNIQFPPQMVRIEVVKNDKEELQLLCKSDANPSPKYNWTRVNTEESKVTPLDTYQVTSATLDFTKTQGDGLYICEAANVMGVNRGYIYMYPSKNFSRCRLGLLISLSVVSCFAILCAGYMLHSRLLNREDKIFFKKQDSIEDSPAHKPERVTTGTEEAQ